MMKRTWIHAAILCCAPLASQAVDIFTDTFDRPEAGAGVLDAVTNGMTGSSYFVAVTNDTWIETLGKGLNGNPTEFPRIWPGALAQIDEESTVTFNHNLIDSVITDEGALAIEVDFFSFGNTAKPDRITGFGIGMDVTQATQQLTAMRTAAPLYVGLNSPSTIEVLSQGTIIGTASFEGEAERSTIKLVIYPADFNAGSSVDFAVTVTPSNGDPALLIPGSFTWAATDQNYFSMGADPFGITSVATVSVKALSSDAPAVPTGLTATGGPRSIQVSWTTNSEPNLAYYNLYSGDSEATITNLLATTLLTDYLHEDLGLNETVYYAVEAVSEASIASPLSAAVSATTDNEVPPPAAPGMPTAVGTNAAALVSWPANSEPTVVGYNVYYGATSDSVDEFIMSVTDTNAYAGKLPGDAVAWLAVTAVNSDDLESEKSEAVSVQILADLTEPGVLFADTFDRADVDYTLDETIHGMSGMVNYRPDTTYTEYIYTLDEQEPRILNNKAVLAWKSTAFLNYNFTNDLILTTGKLIYSVDMEGMIDLGRSDRYNGLVIGLAEADANQQIKAIVPAGDLYVGFYSGSEGGGQRLQIFENGTEVWTNQLSSAEFSPASITVVLDVADFSAGSAVPYDVVYEFNPGTTNSTQILHSGSFTWSGDNENYFALGGDGGGTPSYDNLKISVPVAQPATLDIAYDGADILITSTDMSAWFTNTLQSCDNLTTEGWVDVLPHIFTTSNTWILTPEDTRFYRINTSELPAE